VKRQQDKHFSPREIRRLASRISSRYGFSLPEATFAATRLNDSNLLSEGLLASCCASARSIGTTLSAAVDMQIANNTVKPMNPANLIVTAQDTDRWIFENLGSWNIPQAIYTSSEIRLVWVEQPEPFRTDWELLPKVWERIKAKGARPDSNTWWGTVSGLSMDEWRQHFALGEIGMIDRAADNEFRTDWDLRRNGCV
jgi:hypothetical protein